MSIRNSKVWNIDARALIATISLIGVFVEMPIIMFMAFMFLDPGTALDFIKWGFLLIYSQVGYILGYYFGARNGERREEIRARAAVEARTVSAGLPPQK